MFRSFSNIHLAGRLTKVNRVRSVFFYHRHQRPLVRTWHAQTASALRPFSSRDNDDITKSEVSSSDLKLAMDAAKEDENTTDSNTRTSISDIPGAQTGGKKLAIVFTCKVCETRSAKQFTEQAYRHGVVMVRCPGCENLHLIADRLGFFEDESWDIEKAMQRMGEQVTAINDNNVLELTLKDVAGDKMMEDKDTKSGERNVMDIELDPKEK